MNPLASRSFWLPAGLAFIIVGLFFAWQLDVFVDYIPSPPRPSPDIPEIIFTLMILVFLSLDIGFFFWLKKNGNCPVGVRRSTTLAAFLGGFALLCPVCVFGVVPFLGIALALGIVGPFLPLLQVIAASVLFATLVLLISSVRRSVRA